MSQREPQLIFTGGTLSMARNEQGLLEPSATAQLEATAEHAGFNMSTATRPYIIDSIGLDIGKHYPLLRDAAIKALDEGRNPVVCGGTDSIIWYSTLLAKDLMRRGYLQEGSDQKVVFLSAMKSIQEAPELIARTFEAGKAFAEQSNLNGGFVLSAESIDGRSFAVHDVRNDFDKISAKLVNAFRSKAPAGYIIDNRFTQAEGYKAPAAEPISKNKHYAHIAAPLLHGHDSDAIMDYMHKMMETQPPFEGILIEGIPSQREHTLHWGHIARLPSMVKMATDRGIRVVFCNPVHYNESGTAHTMMPSDIFDNSSSFIRDLKKAGAEFTTALPKDAWLDMTLSAPKQPAHDSVFHGPHSNKRQKVIGIRYVPDIKTMAASVDALAPLAKHLVFSALPGNSMSDAMLPILEKNKAKTRYWSHAEYNGNEYVNFDGHTFLEQAGSLYQEGQATGALVTACPSFDPVRASHRHSWRPHGAPAGRSV